MEKKKPSSVDGPGRSGTQDKRSAHRGKLDRYVQLQIGLYLHGLYDSVVKEGIPDRVAELVRHLFERHKKRDCRDASP